VSDCRQVLPASATGTASMPGLTHRARPGRARGGQQQRPPPGRLAVPASPLPASCTGTAFPASGSRAAAPCPGPGDRALTCTWRPARRC